MKLTHIAALAAFMFASTAVVAEEFGTAAEAEAMVGKAVAHIKSAGKPAAYADFTDKKPDWTDRDLYVA